MTPRHRWAILKLFLLWIAAAQPSVSISIITAAPAPDVPFIQAVSKKFPLPAETTGAGLKIAVDQDGIAYVLAEKGLARLFDDRIALDRTYRPLSAKVPRDIAVSEGRLYQLYADEVISNRKAGTFVHRLGREHSKLAVNNREEVLLAAGRDLTLLSNGETRPVEWPGDETPVALIADGADFIVATRQAAFRITGTTAAKIADGHHFTAAASMPSGVVLGTTNGILLLPRAPEYAPGTLLDRLPSVHITALFASGLDLWAGTTQGVWKRAKDGTFRRFASKRWLDDDHVLDLAVDPKGNAWALTRTGLNKIEFQKMTLAEKAAHYDEKIRQRHIRYGFCAELHMREPGNIASAQMTDTDNDGTWSNYYMASQAFRFGATRDEAARRNAWETFDALERLEEINPLEGFPSRTFERLGFKASDPDRWHPVGDGVWEWKAHTSSDEVIAHMFGSSALYECVARTDAEKKRIAKFVSAILDHIIRNGWQLIDMDGKPTLWGRWNPEYVNGYPVSVFDRRLNSAEIIGALQFGYAITGNEVYKTKAFELMEHHGYLDNILIPMSKVSTTPGQIHLGINLGMEWNHSDDLLAFDSYWLLHRYAFDKKLRSKFARAIQDHWEMERAERCPLWNHVYASTGAREYDAAGALWTLRFFPLDLVDWDIANSSRRDITPLPSNFRGQELAELLPPDERRIARWNSQPFVLNGGSGGHVEYAGDEFLLPYWMGRYLKLIE